MYYFLLLSSLSGIVELGSVFLGIYLGFPTPMVFLFPLFYQLGNLMMNIIPQKKTIYVTLCITIIALTIFSSTKYFLIPLAIQFALTSFCIQAVRDTQKKKCPVLLKRIFRISGFILAPITILFNGQLVMMICATVCLILAPKISIHSNPRQDCVSKPISLVMIFHQMHYFVYTYIMPIYVFQIINSYIVSGIAFAITWIVYLLPQAIASKYNFTCYTFMFFVCHAFLAICMGAMALSSLEGNCGLVLVFWLLTGLGGGSVFCIKRLSNKYSQTSMELSENIGHSIGPAIAIILCMIFPGKEITYLSFTSFGFVLAALIIATLIIQKEKNNNEQ